jgi:crotonobetainyl-CoA:carnitine CoA-transferase CaiB-like acyl-CoA transferase
VQNFRHGVADRLGIGYEAVSHRKPDIIYASLNYAGHVGPYAARPGHEQIAQAVTGMQERFGGDGMPTLQPFAVNDYGTGLMGAYAVALALYHLRRTGEGQHVDTALCYTATMLQSSLLQRYPGKGWDEPRGQHAHGDGPLHRAYEAADGWFFFAARASELARAPELSPLAALPGDQLSQALEALFATRSVADWVADLRQYDLGAHELIADPHHVGTDAWVRAHGLCITRDHGDLGPVTTNGPGMRLSRTPPVPGCPAPKPGSDAASILAQVGLHNVARLADAGVILLDGSKLVR